MKPSQFNVVTAHPQTGELLVFNTASGALAAIDCADAPIAAAALSGATPPEDHPVVGSLSEQGFLVDAGIDEAEPILERIGLGIRDTNRLDVFVLPNMNCNFACPYCFEDHRPSQMDAETERRVLSWLEKMVPRFKAVLLSWFGGEPMLSYPQILRMQHAVRDMCTASQTQLNSHITTNGYQLSPVRAQALCAAGLLSYQITIDGPPDVHNSSRVRKGGGASFGRIYDNLCDLALTQPHANIKLRVNFDTDTLARIPELLRMFPPEVSPRLHLVLERIFGQQMMAGKDHVDVARRTEEVYELARHLGFTVTATPLGPGSLTYCYADRVNQFLFTHTGDVFKCTVSDFKPEDRLGYLDESGQIRWENDRYESWMAIPAIDDECRSCTFMPMCLGGCRKNRQGLGHASSDCKLPFQAMDLRVQQRYSDWMGLPFQEPAAVGASSRMALPIVAIT